MHIALVSHDVITGDGQGRVNVELIRHLLSAGVKVDIYADRVAPDLLDRGARWIHIHPRIDAVNLARVWDFRRRVDQHLQTRVDQYDVILGCGVVLSGPHTVNVAHFVHGTWLDSPYHPANRYYGPKAWYYRLYSRLNARWEKQVWANSRTVVAVSENVRRDIVGLGIPAEKVQVIPNGVDVDEFTPGQSSRAHFGLPSDVPLALFVGDLRSPIKNVDSMLKALERTPSLHLAIAGDATASPYPTQAGRLDIDDRTHFLGYQSDIPSLMRSVDFLVLPSHQDAFGLVVTEAMASGLPVIVSEQVGASCLVDPSIGLVINPPDDVSALASAFQHLTSQADRRKKMGDRARERALDVSWARMGDRYLNLFQSMTGAKPKIPISTSPSTA